MVRRNFSVLGKQKGYETYNESVLGSEKGPMKGSEEGGISGISVELV